MKLPLENYETRRQKLGNKEPEHYQEHGGNTQHCEGTKASLTSAVLAQFVSLGGRPCLGRFAVVAYFFHFWILMDWTALLEMFKGALFLIKGIGVQGAEYKCKPHFSDFYLLKIVRGQEESRQVWS